MRGADCFAAFGGDPRLFAAAHRRGGARYCGSGGAG